MSPITILNIEFNSGKIQVVNVNPIKKLKGSIVHKDRDSQYTAKNYRKKLSEQGIIESYSRRENPYDNACIESFHSVLKKELIIHCN